MVELFLCLIYIFNKLLSEAGENIILRKGGGDNCWERKYPCSVQHRILTWGWKPASELYVAWSSLAHLTSGRRHVLRRISVVSVEVEGGHIQLPVVRHGPFRLRGLGDCPP